jgi:hypothetical protein
MGTVQSSVSDLEAGLNCTRETFERYVQALGLRMKVTFEPTDEANKGIVVVACGCPDIRHVRCACDHPGSAHSPFHPHHCYVKCDCGAWRDGIKRRKRIRRVS